MVTSWVYSRTWAAGSIMHAGRTNGRSTDVHKTRKVIFPAAGGRPLLEGMLHVPDGPGPFPAAVVCHPHPLMGGTMDNAIVVAVCHVLAARGWAALRFNFRGAGASEGHFDEGRGELNDVAGAVTFLRARAKLHLNQVAVVGYSFGAGVGLRHAARDPHVGWLVGIALVQEHYEDPFLDADTRSKLFIVGERDPWAPAEALREYVARLSPPKTLHILPHTDHFFAGCEAEVATSIGKWLNAAPQRTRDQRPRTAGFCRIQAESRWGEK